VKRSSVKEGETQVRGEIPETKDASGEGARYIARIKNTKELTVRRRKEGKRGPKEEEHLKKEAFKRRERKRH